MGVFTYKSLEPIRQEVLEMGWTVSMDPSTQVPGTFWVDAVSEDLLQQVTAYLIVRGFGVSNDTHAKKIIANVATQDNYKYRQYFTRGINQ